MVVDTFEYVKEKDFCKRQKEFRPSEIIVT